MSSSVREFFTIRLSSLPPNLDQNGLVSLFLEEDAALILHISLAPDPLANWTSKIATVTFSSSPSFADEKRRCISTFEWDKDLYGLTPLNHVEAQDLKTDIVAITGLAGRAFDSWANDQGSMWLRDYLPQELPGVRIFIYGYPSKLYKSQSRASLWDYTEGFMRTMARLTETSGGRTPLILIGHSLGCIVIKQAIVESMSFTNAMPSFYRSVCGIVFFGAPHRGLNNPALVKIIGDRPPADLVRDLCPGSSLLVSLNQSFPHICQDFHVVTCFETHATNTPELVDPNDPESRWARTGPPAFAVPRESACLDWSNERRIPVHADHSRIAKLTDSPGSEYWLIRNEIKLLVDGAQDVMTTRVEASLATQDVLDLLFALQYEFAWLKAWGSLVAQNERLEERQLGTFPKFESAIPLVPYGHLAYHHLSEISLLAENLGVILERYRVTSAPSGNNSQGPSAGISQNPNSLSRLPGLNIFSSTAPSEEMKPPKLGQDVFYRISGWSVSDRAQLGFLLQRLQQAKGEVAKIKPYSQLPDLIASSKLINQFSLDSPELSRLDHMQTTQSYSSMSKRASLKRQYNNENDITRDIERLLHPPESIDFKRGSSDTERRSFARFLDKKMQGEKKEAWVLVESRSYDQVNTIQKQREAQDQAFKLALDLSIENKPSSLRALHCVGIVQHLELKRFSFLFEIPRQTDVSKKPLSLHSYLSDASPWGGPAVLPTLSQRIKLAQSLAVSLWELHSAGWLHKSFHSGNVLFFCKRFTDTFSVTEPHIGGFEVSRPDTDGQLSLDMQGGEFDIYKHPELRDESNDLQGRPSFERRHDVYSLGLVLLEIGLWQPLHSFYPKSSTPLKTAQRLLQRAQKNLPHQVGEFCLEAVLSCLDCQEPQLLPGDQKGREAKTGVDTVTATAVASGDDERGGVSLRMFVEKVIYNLEKCHCGG
ncbi:uncharacterized protein A1O5_08131 [Cladophialophora psammophila CBS 110553]|uniref:DUF7580 domain-containing protein n=1 Tax=Cladophialophora psammophila CBS 110553 TaxID=1182543 RepID=W9XD61_9EURO|nr:uncharacterized protein A1O5_08131 [Cladophialophora psammophila CBS 110553]EXJ68339.1 hypothetical protein A1O5_08131 [Cladophialophora psammophila CBS 110553]